MQTWRLRFVLPIVAALVGCQDNRTTSLEKRVADLEQRMRLAEEKQATKTEAATQQESDFKGCVAKADAEYFAAVTRNGTKNRAGYSVPVPVMSSIESQKQHALEECRLLYR